MARARDLAIALGFAIVLIVGGPLVGQIRGAVRAAFPRAFGALVGGIIAVAIGAAVLAALDRIRERRALRYLALAAALVVGAAFARLLRTGNPEVDVVETFHFVEYGLLTLLFYRACRPLNDASTFVLPALAGLLVGTLDEWFQWFVPARVGEMHDVVLDGAAIACGLLFSIGFNPPAHVGPLLRRGSSMRIGATAALLTLVFALFVQSVHLGYDVRDVQIGTFRSHYTGEGLELEARDRSSRWRAAPPLVLHRMSREDQYMSEGLWHVQRRNEAAAAGDAFGAWRENRILEAFYAPVLDTPSYVSRTGYRWPAEQRADTERRAEDDGRPYMSDAQPYPIYTWSKSMFWTIVAFAAGTLMMTGGLGKQKEPPWP